MSLHNSVQLEIIFLSCEKILQINTFMSEETTDESTICTLVQAGSLILFIQKWSSVCMPSSPWHSKPLKEHLLTSIHFWKILSLQFSFSEKSPNTEA